eukprot:scaffold22080_cov125-Isochrysis_galbana.AAC.5
MVHVSAQRRALERAIVGESVLAAPASEQQHAIRLRVGTGSRPATYTQRITWPCSTPSGRLPHAVAQRATAYG